MIDLYTWGTPNGRKVSIMLEEVGLPYRAHPVNIGAGDQFEAAFQEISPGGKVPAIVDRETGTKMMQSGAILLYLAEKTGRLLPTDEDARWQVMEWLMWQMGDLGPMLGQAHHFLKFNAGKAPYAEDRYHSIAEKLYGGCDHRLSQCDALVSRDRRAAGGSDRLSPAREGQRDPDAIGRGRRRPLSAMPWPGYALALPG